MPLFSFPVVVPYTLAGDRTAVAYGMNVSAVATAPAGALAAAKVLTQALSTLRHPGRTAQLATERAKIGAQGRQVEGPYAYVLTKRGPVAHLAFATRIDQAYAETFDSTLKGLDAANVFGVLFDGVHLEYIASMGLAGFAAHGLRLNIQVFRLPETAAKVFAVVGLAHTLPPHPDLQTALKALVAKAAPVTVPTA